MKPIQVAAAIPRGPDGRILLAKRPARVHQGGKWEFPGGKIEPGESVERALERELQEELGITPLDPTPMIRVRHQYADQSVCLDVWEVNAWRGTPHGKEGQKVAWFSPDELATLDFPAANQPIVRAARLPDRYLVTPRWDGPWWELLRGLERALADGIRLVQLRQPARREEPGFRELIRNATTLCRAHDARLLVNGAGTQAWEWALEADGIHLPASALRASLPARPADFWVAASCHDAVEIQAANELGVDFCVLSPVRATRTHPEATPLGWQRFFQLTEIARSPVYALGGMEPRHVAFARAHGGQGIAAIRGLWP